MHHRYDIKGATLGRTLGVSRRHELSLTRKDQDWLDLETAIQLTPEAKSRLLAQLRQDLDFLQACNIMDYSLLVGIAENTTAPPARRVVPGPTTSAASRLGCSLYRQSNGGFRVGPSCTVYLGMIDYLQRSVRTCLDPRGAHHRLAGCSFVFRLPAFLIVGRYNLKKRMETAIRGIRHDKVKFSAVEPALYASRMHRFIDSHVFSDCA